MLPKDFSFSCVLIAFGVHGHLRIGIVTILNFRQSQTREEVMSRVLSWVL